MRTGLKRKARKAEQIMQMVEGDAREVCYMYSY